MTNITLGFEKFFNNKISILGFIAFSAVSYHPCLANFTPPAIQFLFLYLNMDKKKLYEDKCEAETSSNSAAFLNLATKDLS